MKARPKKIRRGCMRRCCPSWPHHSAAKPVGGGQGRGKSDADTPDKLYAQPMPSLHPVEGRARKHRCTRPMQGRCMRLARCYWARSLRPRRPVSHSPRQHPSIIPACFSQGSTFSRIPAGAFPRRPCPRTHAAHPSPYEKGSAKAPSIDAAPLRHLSPLEGESVRRGGSPKPSRWGDGQEGG